MQDPDVNRELKKDIQTIQQARNRDSVSIPSAIEYSLWSLTALSAIGMIVVMPWVGEDKLIPGQMWMGYSLLAILLFAALAVLMRMTFGPVGRDVDASIRRRTEGGR